MLSLKSISPLSDKIPILRINTQDDEQEQTPEEK